MTCLCSDKFRNVPTKLWFFLGGCPPAPPPPPATLMTGNAKEADIWFGRESARKARGKFKDLVCLVVFLCWIKRFVLLSLCLKCRYMNIYFSSFQKSRGDDPPPRKIRGGGGGGTRPPPPGIAAYGHNQDIYNWTSPLNPESFCLNFINWNIIRLNSSTLSLNCCL